VISACSAALTACKHAELAQPVHSEHNDCVTSFGIPTAVLEQARRVADEITRRVPVAVEADEIITGRSALLGLSPTELARLLCLPAALARRGLGPADVDAPDGRVWLRITGHGTDGQRADWLTFGDDAAVSGGELSMAAVAATYPALPNVPHENLCATPYAAC
jgi:hypothetical protein